MSTIKHWIWRLQTPPLVYVSEVLWIVFGGWFFFAYYLFAAICFVITLIFIPFSWNLVKLAIFTFDPIRFDLQENVTHSHSHLLSSPSSPYVILGNIVWFIFFGWHLFIWHMVFAVLQAITVIGMGNAARHVEIALKLLFPFGKSVVRRGYPPNPNIQNNTLYSTNEAETATQPNMTSRHVMDPTHITP